MTANAQQADAFWRLPKVKAETGLGRSTIYRWASEGKFPRPFELGGNRVAWRQAEIEEWKRSRLAEARH